MLLDDGLVLSISTSGESSFMSIQTSANGTFILSAFVGEHDHREHDYLMSTLSFNTKSALFDHTDVLSLAVFSFSCGLWNCVVLKNGTIVASTENEAFISIGDAAVVANHAFVLDPRCTPSIARTEYSNFTVRDAWMGDGEVILHWGGGCYSALEVLVDRHKPRVLAAWAACIGTDIIRTPGIIHAYLGHGTFAVVSAVSQHSPACVGDGIPVLRQLVTGDGFPPCDTNASNYSVNFSEIAVDMFFGELFLKSSETSDSPAYFLSLFKIPWRHHVSGSARHVSDSNISLIPNMVQSRPFCQLTGVIATTGSFHPVFDVAVLRFLISTACSSLPPSCWDVQ
jgi:hypothetical protein